MAIITIHSMIQYSIDFMFADQIIELNSNFVEDLVLSFQKQIIQNKFIDYRTKMFDISLMAELEFVQKVVMLIFFFIFYLREIGSIFVKAKQLIPIMNLYMKEYFCLESIAPALFYLNLKKYLMLLITLYLSQISQHQLMSLCFVIMVVLPFIEEVVIHFFSLKLALLLHLQI